MKHINMAIEECAAAYEFTTAEARLLKRAATLLTSKLRTPGKPLTSPNLVTKAARIYFTFTHAHKEAEVFSVMYLDNQNHLISIVDAFTGTVDSASVYPREIVKQALSLNAVAVVLIHNHPSGVPTPSQADIRMTARLKDALELVGTRVLDHVIIGGDTSVSFAEQGLI